MYRIFDKRWRIGLLATALVIGGLVVTKEMRHTPVTGEAAVPSMPAGQVANPSEREGLRLAGKTRGPRYPRPIPGWKNALTNASGLNLTCYDMTSPYDVASASDGASGNACAWSKPQHQLLAETLTLTNGGIKDGDGNTIVTFGG